MSLADMPTQSPSSTGEGEIIYQNLQITPPSHGKSPPNAPDSETSQTTLDHRSSHEFAEEQLAPGQAEHIPFLGSIPRDTDGY